MRLQCYNTLYSCYIVHVGWRAKNTTDTTIIHITRIYIYTLLNNNTIPDTYNTCAMVLFSGETDFWTIYSAAFWV